MNRSPRLLAAAALLAILSVAVVFLVRGRRQPSSSPAQAASPSETERAPSHSLTDAEMLMARGLAMLGVAVGELPGLRKGNPRKVLVALAIKESTTMPLGWIAQRLEMGTRSTVSREVAALARRLPSDGELARAYQRLVPSRERASNL